MRLVNKHTLELEWFLDDQAPPYIILSHRWVGQETSLQDFTAAIQNGGNDKAKILKNCSDGLRKIVRLCEEVTLYTENYVWIDTCCIDKTSSAELQEAINSMYRWYQQATLCIVFMDDVESKHKNEQLPKSRWFTRGWTLQELLAPTRQKFVDKDWKDLGERKQLASIISQVTGISPACFGNPKEIYATPVATRFSWLSQRTSTRIEDMAYASLSLFNVNMTMLYGEGEKAFLRLQREIISLYDDETIFLWSEKQDHGRYSNKKDMADVYGSRGTSLTVLAPRPECFASCKGRTITKDVFFDREPLRVTAKGLELENYDLGRRKFEDELSVALNCRIDGERAGISLQKVSGMAGGENRWRRVETDRIGTVTKYETPPTSEQQYHRQAHAKAMARMNALRQGQNAGWNTRAGTDSSGFSFGEDMRESVGFAKFKIFIL